MIRRGSPRAAGDDCGGLTQRDTRDAPKARRGKGTSIDAPSFRPWPPINPRLPWPPRINGSPEAKENGKLVPPSLCVLVRLGGLAFCSFRAPPWLSSGRWLRPAGSPMMTVAVRHSATHPKQYLGVVTHEIHYLSFQLVMNF